MGVFQKDDLALDFHGGRTEDFSSTIPYMNKLNTHAKMLVSQLDINSNYNKKGLVLFNESDHYDMYKLFEKSTNINNNDNNFSETSPFISSDVYNQLLKKIKNKQTGGASKKVSQKHSKNSNKSSSASDTDKSSASDKQSKRSKRSKKSVSSTKSSSESPEYEDKDNDHDHDFEDESSTSSDSGSDSDKKTQNKKIKHIFKEKSDKFDLEPEEEENEFSDMSAVSYLSSSAHTDNNTTDNNSSAKSRTSTVSAKNHHRRNYSESINTSDINIISVDD